MWTIGNVITIRHWTTNTDWMLLNSEDSSVKDLNHFAVSLLTCADRMHPIYKGAKIAN